MTERRPWQAQRAALGAIIRSEREFADLSLRQLAESADVSNAYLSQVERGIHEPSVRVLQSIVEALGLSMQAFLRQAGIIEVADTTAGVEAAIGADPDLKDAQKKALIAVYRSYLAEARTD